MKRSNIICTLYFVLCPFVLYAQSDSALNRSVTVERVPSSTCADILFAECTSIRSEFENLKAQFVKDCNLFVSDDDIKLISKQLSKTDKALKDLEIKVQNTKLLMLR